MVDKRVEIGKNMLSKNCGLILPEVVKGKQETVDIDSIIGDGLGEKGSSLSKMELLEKLRAKKK